MSGWFDTTVDFFNTLVGKALGEGYDPQLGDPERPLPAESLGYTTFRGQLANIYPPGTPEFDEEVERTWEGLGAEAYEERDEQGTLITRGLPRWRVSDALSREWEKMQPPSRVKRDRPKAIQQFEKLKTQRGMRPGQDPRVVDQLKTQPAEVVLPSRYGKIRL